MPPPLLHRVAIKKEAGKIVTTAATQNVRVCYAGRLQLMARNVILCSSVLLRDHTLVRACETLLQEAFVHF